MKTLLLAVIFFSIGYIASVFWPMPVKWQQTIKAPVEPGGFIADKVPAEWLPFESEPNVVESTQLDSTQYATQQDLLLGLNENEVVFSILLGEYHSKEQGDKHLQYIGIQEVRPLYVPYKDPLGGTSFLLLLGEFKEQHAATAQLNAWESVYDVNLKVVKKPQLDETSPEPSPGEAKSLEENVFKVSANKVSGSD